MISVLEIVVYCIFVIVRRKGLRFLGNVCLEWKIRIKMAEVEVEEEKKKEEGSYRGSLVEEGSVIENWIGVRIVV